MFHIFHNYIFQLYKTEKYRQVTDIFYIILNPWCNHNKKKNYEISSLATF